MLLLRSSCSGSVWPSGISTGPHKLELPGSKLAVSTDASLHSMCYYYVQYCTVNPRLSGRELFPEHKHSKEGVSRKDFANVWERCWPTCTVPIYKGANQDTFFLPNSVQIRGFHCSYLPQCCVYTSFMLFHILFCNKGLHTIGLFLIMVLYLNFL